MLELGKLLDVLEVRHTWDNNKSIGNITDIHLFR